jgi:glycosyltransferase involved in cell wall biosynthesis
MKNKVAIIIPAFNEETVIASNIKDIRKTLGKSLVYDIIVVNDGSRDGTAEVASRVADYVLTHRRNCGLGAAISTGLEFARRGSYSTMVTLDADGQHDPGDMAKGLNKLNAGYDIVIGSRFKGTHSGMHGVRRLILYLSNFFTFLFFGIWTTDSQSGFRVLSHRAIDTLKLESNRMEVSSEFFGQIKRSELKMAEVGIHVRYTEYSKRKGQSNTNGFKVLVKLLYQIIRY